MDEVQGCLGIDCAQCSSAQGSQLAPLLRIRDGFAFQHPGNSFKLANFLVLMLMSLTMAVCCLPDSVRQAAEWSLPGQPVLRATCVAQWSALALLLALHVDNSLLPACRVCVC